MRVRIGRWHGDAALGSKNCRGRTMRRNTTSSLAKVENMWRSSISLRLTTPAARGRSGRWSRELYENKVIGLSWAVIDYDGNAQNNGFWNLGTEHAMYGNASLLREFRLMPLEPQFQKAIEAKWSFKVLDMKPAAGGV